MSISRINQIKRIVKDHPVTDPRGAMLAIEQVLAQKEPKGAKPVAVIKVFDNPESSGPLKATVKIEYSGKRLEPRHMAAVGAAIRDFAEQRAAEEDRA